MHANRQISRSPLTSRTLALARSSIRPTTSLSTGKALTPSEVLETADNVAKSGGLLSCIDAYIRYRRVKHPGADLPVPDYICGPHDPEVCLDNVLEPELWDLMCTSCGATDEWIETFLGKDKACRYYKCVRCERHAELDDDSCGTFCVHDKKNAQIRTWISIRRSVRDAVKAAHREMADREIAGRPSRVHTNGDGKAKAEAEAEADGAVERSEDEEAAFSVLRGSAPDKGRTLSPSPSPSPPPPPPKPRTVRRSQHKATAARGRAAKQAHKLRTATVSLELMNGKFRDFAGVQIVDNRLEWEAIQDTFSRIVKDGKHGLEGFDRLYQTWRRFGVNGSINLRLRQTTVSVRVVHAAALPVEPVELPNDHVHAGQKRLAPAPLTMSRPTKRSKLW